MRLTSNKQISGRRQKANRQKGLGRMTHEAPRGLTYLQAKLLKKQMLREGIIVIEVRLILFVMGTNL